MDYKMILQNLNLIFVYLIKSRAVLFGFPLSMFLHRQCFKEPATHSAHHMSLSSRLTLLKVCLNDLWGRAGYKGQKDQVLKDRQREGNWGQKKRGALLDLYHNTRECVYESNQSCSVWLDSDIHVHTHTNTHRHARWAIIQLCVCFCLGDTALCSHLLSD